MDTEAVECVYRAALTCGSEKWNSEANSSGITLSSRS